MTGKTGSERLERAARALVERLLEGGLTLSCAESCTGGMAAAAITGVPGASEAFWGGVVAYSNDCKTRILGVSIATLSSHGAVSREAAREMAAGALAASGSDLAFSITGVAGPGGGSDGKPVGGVWLGWASASGLSSEAHETFAGDRDEVRTAAAARALEGCLELAASLNAPSDVVPEDGPAS